jgi:hypothetical protein
VGSCVRSKNEAEKWVASAYDVPQWECPSAWKIVRIPRERCYEIERYDG